MKEIQKRQNEQKPLEIQAIARILYNRAEKINSWLWILPILSYLTIFITSDSFDNAVTIVCFLIDVVAVALQFWFERLIKFASKCKKIFDYYVLGFSNSINIDSPYDERLLKVLRKRKQEISLYTSNTGKDSPPGVKDWYTFIETSSSDEAKFECQKQNKWWDEKLTKFRLFKDLILFVILLFVFVIVVKNSNPSWVRMVFSSIIIIRLVERIITNLRYMVLSIQISGAVSILENNKNEEQLLRLQEKIDAKRELSVVGWNFLHSKFAKRLTEAYESLKKI